MVYLSVYVIFNFLSSVSQFSKYRSFTYLGRFIPRYFILYNKVANEKFPLTFSF